MPVTRLHSETPIRTIWFGMRCPFTQAAIAGAMSAGEGIMPVAIVLPASPVAHSAGWPEPPFDRWLRKHDIAVVEVRSLAGDDLRHIVDIVRDQNVTLGVGACLPWKVPRRLREAIPAGVLNIHPSLLPELRGAEPVFHAYRQGLSHTGVTVHVMDDGWDSGPILTRQRIAIPASCRAEVFEADLARRGGEVLAGIAHRWARGQLPATPQDHARATWAPIPTNAHRRVHEALTMEQALRFVAACGPLEARDADSGVIVAVDIGDNEDVANLPRRIRVACADGSIWLDRVMPGPLKGVTGID